MKLSVVFQCSHTWCSLAINSKSISGSARQEPVVLDELSPRLSFVLRVQEWCSRLQRDLVKLLSPKSQAMVCGSPCVHFGLRFGKNGMLFGGVFVCRVSPVVRLAWLSCQSQPHTRIAGCQPPCLNA